MAGIFHENNVSDLIFLTEANRFTEFQKALRKHESK